MVRLLVRIKNKNLQSGYITMDRENVALYYQNKVDSLVVLTEDNQFVEEYYGSRLQILMESVRDSGNGYLFAKRNLMEIKHDDMCRCDNCV